VIILNSFLFLGNIYILVLEKLQDYKNEKELNKKQGINSFPHYLWKTFVFTIFDLFQKKTDWSNLKSLVIAPFVEEFLYRGIIFGIYRDSGHLFTGKINPSIDYSS